MAGGKHSQGPWRTDKHGNIVCYPEGLSVGVLSRQLPEGEIEANHLLIVAAPDLLETMKEVAAWAQQANPAGYGGLPRALQRMVDAAIAKAEGGAQ